MKNKAILEHDLVIILRSFSESELKKFGDFLSSPYFSYRPSLKKAYNELIKFHPLYTHVSLTKEYLYQKVFPKKKINNDTMRVLLSLLHDAAVKFLAYENISKDININFNLFKELKERNLISQYSNQVYKISNNIESKEEIDSDYFMLKFKLAAELNYLDIRTDKLITPYNAVKLVEQTRLGSIYIIIYFISEIVTNYTNLIINADRFSSAALDEHIYNTIKGFSPEKLFAGFRGISKYDFIIDVYKTLLTAFIKRGSWKAYNNYKKEVQKNLISFSYDETSFHYSHLISCTMLGVKYGHCRNKFDNELLELYSDFIDKNLYIDNKVKYIPSNLYRAILLHGVKMDSLEWLHRIISEAEPKLHPDDRENMQYYANGQYYFALGRFDESLEFINKLSIDNFIFKYDLYELKLRIYFDREMYEPALELIHSYRQFIRKDPMVPPGRKTWHRNFTYYTEKLIKASLINSRIDVEILILKLQKINNIYHKQWLLDRVNVLLKPSVKFRKIG